MDTVSQYLAAFNARQHYFVLNADHSVSPATLLEWSRSFEDYNHRRVKRTHLGYTYVSTVFLGLDHAHMGPPHLFETMIFGGSLDEYQTRCSTYEQALDMHAVAVAEAMDARRHWWQRLYWDLHDLPELQRARRRFSRYEMRSRFRKMLKEIYEDANLRRS